MFFEPGKASLSTDPLIVSAKIAAELQETISNDVLDWETGVFLTLLYVKRCRQLTLINCIIIKSKFKLNFWNVKSTV